MRLRLSWIDPATGRRKEPSLETPIALGSDFNAMPGRWSDLPVSRAVILDPSIAPFHALIEEVEGGLLVGERSPPASVAINGTRLPSGSLFDGDRVRLGEVEIAVSLAVAGEKSGCDRWVGFLVKRRCGRPDPAGCPHCQGDPYEDDYRYYPGFGSYLSLGNERVDFTEADARAFDEVRDSDFERDMGAS